jgi:hypothetical protein
VGLDIKTVDMLSKLLEETAQSQSPRIILSLRPDEHMPRWLTHLVFLLDDFTVYTMGPRETVLDSIHSKTQDLLKAKNSRELTEDEAAFTEVGGLLIAHAPCEPKKLATNTQRNNYQRAQTAKLALLSGREGRIPRTTSLDGFKPVDTKPIQPGEPLVEMRGVRVVYGDKVALGDWEREQDGKTQGGLWWTVRRGERWGVFGPNGKYPSSRVMVHC